MIHQPNAHSNYSYLNGKLARSKNIQISDDQRGVQEIQDRACSSLCQLSNNICIEDRRKDSKFFLKKSQYGFSPWKVKRQEQRDEQTSVNIKKKLSNRMTIYQANKKYEGVRCFTQNKQNFDQFKDKMKHQPQLNKNKSIFFKIMGVKEARGSFNCKSDHPDIEMVALLRRKRRPSFQIIQGNFSKELQKIQIGTQNRKNLTPKILNLSNIKRQQHSRESSKKICKNGAEGWTQQIRQSLKMANQLTEHWKTKSQHSKTKRVKKIVVIKDAKSIQARQVKENVLMHKKISLSLDRQKKIQYKCNNPLTRLLYDKYLHTIGLINHSSKENRIKFL